MVKTTIGTSVARRLGRAQFPDNYYWGRDFIENDTIFLAQDNTLVPMVVFTNSYLTKNVLKGSDYAFITNQPETYAYNPTDVFINGVRIEFANIKCKNGVIHRLEKLITPLTNMAEVVCVNDSTKRFAELLDRFSAPFLSTGTIEMADGTTKPVYVKKYFTTRGHKAGLEQFKGDADYNSPNVTFMTTPTDSTVGAGLDFDPGWNTLTSSTNKSMSQDMAAMFVPTTEALDKFLKEGGGKFLYDRYKGWEGIPDHVLADLLNNHMTPSFTASVPSKFTQVKNDDQINMGIKNEHVTRTILCCNGVVYLTNEVYTPVSYRAVTAPTLVNDNMDIMRWAVEKYGFLAYLHSMDSYYSYLLPTDEEFWYLDPLSVAKGEPEYWKFLYDDDLEKVRVFVYDSLRVVPKGELVNSSIIQNRLEDIIDQHIIVDTLENVAAGKYYYQTKGNGTVKVTKNLELDHQVSEDGTIIYPLNIYGGFQVENDEPIVVSTSRIMPSGENGNGTTYIIPSLAQSPLKSVYTAMEERAGDRTAPYHQFFKLMQDAGVFIMDDTYAMSGEYTVDVFNTYHYTIYVPSNDSIEEAINNGLLPTIETAEAYLKSIGVDPQDPEGEEYLDLVRSILHDFVCYHIHDNSVYVGGAQINNREYQTGTLDPVDKIFRRLKVTADESSLVIRDYAGNERRVNVDKEQEGIRYNVMTRDYLFNDGMSGISDDDLNIAKCTQIETSSFAVVHGIDGILLYDTNQLQDYQEQLGDLQKELEK